ncbi:putative DnaJ chaperone protein [Trypanosoma grayi]|uniref:putative DnaJ chaperone protein n=1 Tax=Trypanosoma grayi TaxID=71804 RepID=UPI0004F49B12|nr:putative DnaJ chaperone protein [Trypanosoma grayi]KEG07181.1 putative DnaJ chaperone protein [Trypanosoma grayi]
MQKDVLAFLQQHDLLDETATNKLLRHAVRRPNVMWLFSKISNAEDAAAVLSDVTSGNTERRPAPAAAATQSGKDDDDEGVEVEAVLRFNALVEKKEQQTGMTRYGEPVKKSTAADAAVSEKANKKKGTTNATGAPSAAAAAKWDDEDLVRLQKATAKYPPGTVDRWRKVATMLRDKFTEEEAMAKVNELTAVLHHANNSSNNTRTAAQQPAPDAVKVSSLGAAAAVVPPVPSAEDWTVKQQKMLEQGLREMKDYKEKDKFQKIAAMVDGKNAKECFERFKYLCAMNKRK